MNHKRSRAIISAITAVVLVVGLVPAPVYGSEISAAVMAEAEDTTQLPERFDLRDEGRVSPVKNQDPWGTCWSFGTMAASEASILSELGKGYSDFPLDFSVRNLAWFAGTALPDQATMEATPALKPYASQAGEGTTILSTSENEHANPLETGGFSFYAATALASGIGPVPAQDVPYRNNENMANYKLGDDDEVGVLEPGQTLADFLAANPGKTYHAFAQKSIEDGEEMTSPRRAAQVEATPELAASGALSNYALEPIFDKDGNFISVPSKDTPDYDWSVPAGQRFNRMYELEESNVLPQPTGGVEGQGYQYNAQATEAIKRELRAGRGVAVSLFDDSITHLDEEGNSRFTNRENWSQYTYDEGGKVHGAGHVACIVGWDDAWAKEKFKVRGVMPPADGAWIVKNSYGYEGAGFPNEGAGGYLDENGKHTGYLYVSYYDMSLSLPETFDYDTSGHVSDVINQYDLMPAPVVHTEKYATETSCANVFTVESDQLARALSVETEQPATKVKLELRELADEAATPEGTCLAAVEQTFEWGGYHRIALDEAVPLARGNRYAVVATMTTQAADGKTTYHAPVHRDVNASSTAKYGAAVTTYVKGVVNEGESFLMKDGKWADWNEQIAAGKQRGKELEPQLGDNFTSGLSQYEGALNPYYDYDNFSLKIFSDDAKDDAKSIDGAKLVLSAKKLPYTGSVLRPAVETVGGHELVEDVDFTVSWPKSKNVGTYTVVAVGQGAYSGTSASATYQVVRASNPLRVSGKTIEAKAKTLKKGSETFNMGAAFAVAGKLNPKKLAFKKSSGARKIVVKPSGLVVLKKGLAKKAYTVKVRVVQQASKNYKAKTLKAIELRVEVR